ncbi:hypothetical protein ANOM_002507 [Aspergillus nomiae NRRL 13137]|uniref:Uncharacterized protein n=1 Tax=Aspergillus nomiae NRRL (strain ATCC 15546 / NRRL 13137 / CBS 260.88 / M93) TaxID=1509407 RepID=A0A0L1J9A9_ASPN3|nr:uncharacterized protein ANOM_002507 [Aspergillus nomiae NRRL 13137]KNG88285.1 hypothetical protein ANOM_002507 [Aspergillus nomiae NRRL 13137]
MQPKSLQHDELAALIPDGRPGASPLVAIVGMAMRLPGGVRTTEDFWQFLINKRDGHCEVPKMRYGIDGFYNAHDERYTHTRHGYFLPEDPAYFDAPFFSVTEQDASTMDPQQRLLLEVVWECLENAGETNWEGKNIGCYVGVFGEDWLGLSHGDPLSIDRSHAISTGSYALANTVSYKFDLRGPSMTIQTGCSSSMVGIHEACQSLATGACSSAIVAGTNLILSPSMTTSMSGNMVLSTSGVCRTFDAEADGYGRGEAINALYLKPLGDAIKANDAIRAIIRSTAANSDGGTSSIAVPSIIAQEHLILDAYRRGNINDLSETAFVECHGTGTRAGDQVETTAVANVFEGQEIVIGAVKPNFGHSEGASGITSVIKAWLGGPSRAYELAGRRRRRVSVNAFGIGGTNAHVILDSAHDVCAKDPAQGCIGPENDVKLLVISAQDAKSLKARIDQVTDYANRHPERSQDLSFTLGVRRKHLAHRAFAVYDPTSPLSPSDFQSAHPHVSAQLTFVFTGQGAQWPGMGQGLIKAYQCFKMDILELENVLRSIEDPPQWSLMEELSCATASRINEAEFCQPLCTAVQIGVVNLLAAWGIRPASVVGHSSGEIAAAYAAGAISARSAIILAYYRGKLAQAQKGTGGMASIGLGSDEVSPYLVDGVVIACKNSPQSVTISGEQGQIDQMVRNIQNDLPDTFCRKLQLDMAYHSHYMAAVGPIYEKSISNHLQLHQQMLPMFSSVDVRMITDPQTLNAAYWRRNLESTVLFSDAISSLFAERHKKHILVEIGPHCALSAPIQQIIRAYDLKICPAYIPTLFRNDANCQHQLLTSVGSIHRNGAFVDLLAVNGTGHVLTDILPYPWQHGTRYWKESRMVREWRLNEVPPHELLGSRSTESTSLEPAWRQFISLENIPWLSDHIIQGKVVFPAAAYIAMVGEAILQLSPGVVSYTVRNAIFKAPLVIEESENVEVITTLRPARLNDLADSEWFSFTIASYDGTNWIKNCSGQVRAGACGNISPVSIKPYARRVSSSKWYDTLASLGLSYGAQFRGLQDISVDPKGSRAVAKVNNKAGSPACRYSLHPTMIDQCLQVMSVAGAAGLPRRIATGAIPASIDQIFIGEGENHMEATVDTVQESGSSLVGDATAILGDKVVLKMKRGLCFALGNKNDSISPQTPLVARIQWKPDPDLCKPEDLLPRAATSLGRLDQMKKLGQVSLLYILETAERIKPLVPQSTHASKWKSWILYEDAAVRNGEHTLLPESKAWATQSSEERQALIKKLSTTQADQPGEHNIIITCTEVIYENCLEIMANKISTLDLLMEENRLGRIYQFDQENSDWSIFITYLSHSNPWLRILEIGAGTGSATAEALRSLCVSGMPMYSKYTFTDISPGFMTAAQGKFRENVNMEYKVLDISSDPLKQSFVGQSFDLIIASNVLHATPVLKQALKNVKRLLAPHGWLLLHELAPVMPYVDYIMGTLPGWWIGEDDGRINRPYISPEDWDKKLQYAGFTGTEAIRYDSDTYHLCVDIITRPAPVETATQPIVLLTDGSPDLWAGKVFSELEKQNFIVEWGKLEEAPSGHACVVFLLEHRDPFLAKLSEKRYHCLQKYLMGVGQSKLLWVTKTTQFDCKDPDCGLVLGFARTLRQEMMLDFYTLEIDVFDTESAKAVGPIVRKILKPTNRDNQDPNYEYAYHNNTVFTSQCYWGAAANILRPSKPDTGKKLSMSIPGLLDTLEWLDSSYGSLGQDDVEVDIDLLFQFMLWHDEGKIKPIRPTTVFAACEAIEAFRLMQQGTHIGKILIRMPDDASQLSQRPSEVEVLFSSTASYLLVGGLGGLGRAVSRWMVEQGARYLVYLSRTAGSTEEHSEFIQELNAMGCHVECIQGSVTRTEDVQAAISRCKSPLKGVFQMSMSLNDRPFPHMSYEEWSSSLSPKVQGTWNLHNSVLQEDLDFFVLFSSAVGICGHGSQANYAAANTFLDGFTQYRRRLGLPSSAIALGAVGETGLVAREAKVMQAMQSIGIWLLNEDEVLEGLKKCIGESNTVDCTESAARLSAPLIIGLGNNKSLSNPDIQTMWRRDARFASYTNLDSISVKQESGSSVNKIRELIIKAELDPLILLQKETETTITQELNQLIAKSLPGAQDMDDEAKTSLAIDSLMAIEVRNWIRRNLQVEISLPEISRARTAGGLIDMTLTRLKMRYQVSDTEGTQNAVAETSFDLDTSR